MASSYPVSRKNVNGRSDWSCPRLPPVILGSLSRHSHDEKRYLHPKVLLALVTVFQENIKGDYICGTSQNFLILSLSPVPLSMDLSPHFHCQQSGSCPHLSSPNSSGASATSGDSGWDSGAFWGLSDFEHLAQSLLCRFGFLDFLLLSSPPLPRSSRKRALGLNPSLGGGMCGWT